MVWMLVCLVNELFLVIIAALRPNGLMCGYNDNWDDSTSVRKLWNWIIDFDKEWWRLGFTKNVPYTGYEWIN